MWMRNSLAACTSCIGTFRHFVAADKPDNVNIRDDDETVFQHAFDCLRGSCDFFHAVDYRHHHRHVAHRVEKALSMLMALCAVAENTAVNGRAGDLHHSQLLDDCVVKGFRVPFVSLSDEYPQELCLTLGTVVRQLWLRLCWFPGELHDRRVLDL